MPLLRMYNGNLLVSLDSDGNLLRADAHVSDPMDYYQECTERLRNRPTILEEIQREFDLWEMDQALSAQKEEAV